MDKPTWGVLEPHLEVALSRQAKAIQAQLGQFRGDLDWVHRQEGHVGHPYWPGGASGVTLDPSVDLGQAEASVIGLFEPLTTAEQFAAMQTVVGLTQQAAKDVLDANAVLQSIRIGREQAEELMAFTAKPYWNGIGGRFSALRQPSTIGSVQTAPVPGVQPRRAQPRAGTVAITARGEPVGRRGGPHRPDATGAAHLGYRDQTARGSVHHSLRAHVSG